MDSLLFHARSTNARLVRSSFFLLKAGEDNGGREKRRSIIWRVTTRMESSSDSCESRQSKWNFVPAEFFRPSTYHLASSISYGVCERRQLLVIPFARDKCGARDDRAVHVRRNEHDTVFRLNRLNNVITNNEHVIWTIELNDNQPDGMLKWLENKWLARWLLAR